MKQYIPKDKDICVILDAYTVQEAKKTIRDAYRIVKKDQIEFASREGTEIITDTLNAIAKRRIRMGDSQNNSVISKERYGSYFNKSTHKVAFVSEQFLTMLSFLPNGRNGNMVFCYIKTEDLEKIDDWYSIYKEESENINTELNDRYRKILTKIDNMDMNDRIIINSGHDKYDILKLCCNNIMFVHDTIKVDDVCNGNKISISEEGYVTNYNKQYMVQSTSGYAQYSYWGNMGTNSSVSPYDYIRSALLHKLYSIMSYNKDITSYLYKDIISKNKAYLVCDNITDIGDETLNYNVTNFKTVDQSSSITVNGKHFKLTYELSLDLEETIKYITSSKNIQATSANKIKKYMSKTGVYAMKPLYFKLKTHLIIDDILEVSFVHYLSETRYSNNSAFGISSCETLENGLTYSSYPELEMKTGSICTSYEGKELLDVDKYDYAADIMEEFYEIIKKDFTNEKISSIGR